MWSRPLEFELAHVRKKKQLEVKLYNRREVEIEKDESSRIVSAKRNHQLTTSKQLLYPGSWGSWSDWTVGGLGLSR